MAGELDGTSGQDRESYSDTQDRDNYTVDEVEFVDPILVARPHRPAEYLHTCSVCCALVRDDYMEGHREWHQQ